MTTGGASATHTGNEANPQVVDRLLRRSEVEHKTGLSRSVIYQLMHDGDFPRPVPISKNTVAWVESEVNRWMENRIRLRERTPHPSPMPSGVMLA